jgi:NAD+ synthase (glutamine-hydrolysing)
VGELKGNTKRMLEEYNRAIGEGADLVVFGELAVCGYPPEDLLLKRHFMEDCRAALEGFAGRCKKAAVITGFAELDKSGRYNSAAVIKDGKISEIYRKERLINYGIFDEARYFQQGTKTLITEIKGFRTAVTICADIWSTDWLGEHLGGKQNVDLLVNISASPFRMGKTKRRQTVIKAAAKKLQAPIFYCNIVGGQDEVVYDGSSMIAEQGGEILAKAAYCESDILTADVNKLDKGEIQVSTQAGSGREEIEEIEQLYNALVLATGDYVRKNNFKKALVALSGGIDSSVVAAVSVKALGAENVTGITIPTRFNSSETQRDAAKTAENLGIEFMSIPIQSVLGEFDKQLGAVKSWNNQGIAYENLQARIRGIIMMSLSNHLGAIVLTSGNKSETAVGYATLYGDTAGGFAVIKDVYKTMVYKLAEFVNRKEQAEIIPKTVITRAPTAELREGQRDSDSLPNYSVLDEILRGYLEEEKSVKQLIREGLDGEQVKKTVNLVEHNEYKRRQCPVGVRISQKAFGRDRRFPITNKYREDF